MDPLIQYFYIKDLNVWLNKAGNNSSFILNTCLSLSSSNVGLSSSKS